MFIAIVPVYNEEKSILSVINDLKKYVDQVVVVDDCSSDNIGELLDNSGAVVLKHEINRGQGAALQTGHEYAMKAGADFVLHFDGDGQFDAEDIGPALETLINNNADIVFGSRFLDNRSRIPFFKKYFILPFGRMFNWFFWRINLSDSHNGFRILNRKALEKIVISQDRMAHASEIPVLAKKYGLKIVEHPVKVTYREYGQGIGGGIKIIGDLLIGKFVK
jgi:polyprenyl-phospho-N-acetylgalactosaminyl synthase